jgi:hypothetical protein
MTLAEFREALAGANDDIVTFCFPDGSYVPRHCHLTELGVVRRTSIDCGGVTHNRIHIVFQVWYATDVDHLLTARKMLSILDRSAGLLSTAELPIEVEYGQTAAASYRMLAASRYDGEVRVMLEGRPTECLAPDKCGITGCGPTCCPASPEPGGFPFDWLPGWARGLLSLAVVLTLVYLTFCGR